MHMRCLFRSIRRLGRPLRRPCRSCGRLWSRMESGLGVPPSRMGLPGMPGSRGRLRLMGPGVDLVARILKLIPLSPMLPSGALSGSWIRLPEVEFFGFACGVLVAVPAALASPCIPVGLPALPLRGAALTFLPHRKQGKQRQRAHTASLWVSTTGLNPERSGKRPALAPASLATRHSSTPLRTPCVADRSARKSGAGSRPMRFAQGTLCPTAGCAARRWRG